MQLTSGFISMDNIEDYGKLFHHDIYGKDSMLFKQTLYEIGTHLGHSLENPISLSLLCLQFMMSYDTCSLIYVDILKLIEGKDTPELKTLDQIEEIVTKHFKDKTKLSELELHAFVKAMAKCWLPELKPYLKILLKD